MNNNNDHDHDYYRELDTVDRERLTQAAGFSRYAPDGEARYEFYRRRGYCPTDALAYALAWCRNAVEQAERRRNHQTGCAIAV